mmetsp:Transcript_17223/g.51526  ORF Transcript_17223/g.51526 Transcript_17223/m.51526 type:complete len:367 (-) Transcript_17223:59-1159(-)
MAMMATGGSLKGQRIIVTGSNSGIGRETASELAARGAAVTLACRNVAAAKTTAEDIRKHHPGADVRVGAPLDLGSAASIRAFVHAEGGPGKPLHVLVNNAGANYLPRRRTNDGFCTLAQVNYLGPYLLTRLLEPSLLAAAPRARVVNLSSVMSRLGSMPPNPRDYLTSEAAGGENYAASKLANVFFTYEAQRRLAPLGVQSCAVDPGSVNTDIYRSVAMGRGVFKAVREFFCSPPREGAAAVVHAASEPWPEARGRQRSRGSSDSGDVPRDELRFYGRGLFGTPPLAWVGGPYLGPLGALKRAASSLPCLFSAALDQPLRRITGGRLGSITRQVQSASSSYDTDYAAALWDVSAEALGLPRDPVAK